MIFINLTNIPHYDLMWWTFLLVLIDTIILGYFLLERFLEGRS